jgi:hypothetical protein
VKICIELNLEEDLSDSMYFEDVNFSYQQSLDYVGIPFRCLILSFLWTP